MDYGKRFEQQIKKDFSDLDVWYFRLNDQMSGFKSVSKNPCDIIVYNKPDLFLIEAKSFLGNTFNVNFRQYDILYSIWQKHIDGLRIGVLMWFRDHDKIVWVPLSTFVKLRQDGKKSFNIKMLDGDEYPSLVIPSKKLRTYLRSDYSTLLKEGCNFD